MISFYKVELDGREVCDIDIAIAAGKHDCNSQLTKAGIFTNFGRLSDGLSCWHKLQHVYTCEMCPDYIVPLSNINCTRICSCSMEEAAIISYNKSTGPASYSFGETDLASSSFIPCIGSAPN
jgi:hypothetical protein